MSYQVLARKWRPSRFEEMVGQEHVLRALINALNSDRLHHAYLFTGTRGVGKTTIARILAKCLNCEQGVSATPCGECSSCKEIAEGRFIDLIEVDAASRTKVDDTREMLENVQYTPTRGRYKVYLIDEVHMLSAHSFNALLKTLEEPPPHVKFLLATTDPQKLPVTVLSRCLQFNLKHVPREMITEHLTNILTAENIKHEPAGVQQIAQSAEGSLRDALSLLDQAISYGDGAIREAEIGQMLGSISRTHLYQILDAVARNNAEEIMAVVDELAAMAPDYAFVLSELSSLLHYVALLQQVPAAKTLQNYGDLERLEALAGLFNPEDIQLYYEICVHAQRDLSILSDGRQGLEMALLRMLAFMPEQTTRTTTVKKTAARPAVTEKKQAAPVSEQKTVVPAESKPVEPVVEKSQDAKHSTEAQANNQDWEAILSKLPLAGMSKAFASHCSLKSVENDMVTLQLSSKHEALQNANVENKLTTALSDHFSRPVKLNFEVVENKPESPAEKKQREIQELQHEAEAVIAADPFVESMAEAFDASVIPDSVTPE